MSYIRAQKMEIEHGPTGRLLDGTLPADDPTLDMNLDDEALPFVQALLGELSELGEGEALVIWKEIF